MTVKMNSYDPYSNTNLEYIYLWDKPDTEKKRRVIKKLKNGQTVKLYMRRGDDCLIRRGFKKGWIKHWGLDIYKHEILDQYEKERED